MKQLRVFLILIITSFLYGCPWDEPSEDENPLQALGGPFSEKASVKTDRNGNFLAVWKDGASMWSKYYPQGAGQTPFRIDLGSSPALDMTQNGDAYLVYHRAESDNNNINNTFMRRFDGSTSSWQDELYYSFKPRYHNFDPGVAVHDDLVVMTNRVTQRPVTTTADSSGISAATYKTDLSTTLRHQDRPLLSGNRGDYFFTFQPEVAAAANLTAMMLFAREDVQGLDVSHLAYHPVDPFFNTWSHHRTEDKLTTEKVRQGNYK